MKFENPQNGYVEEVSEVTWLWCLLFGGFYFAFKGIWIHAVIGLGAAFLTWGISWLIYPMFARLIVINHFQKSGWREVTGNEPDNRMAIPSTEVAKPVEPSRGVANKASEPLKAAIDSPNSEQYSQGDRNLNSARYKLYLSEKYGIKRNDLFEKYVCLDEMFETVDEAVVHADLIDRERAAALQEQNEKRLNTVVRRGVIGPRKKFDFAELTTGEVVVDHPSGVSKRFKSHRAAELYLLGFMTTEDTLIDMQKDTKPD